MSYRTKTTRRKIASKNTSPSDRAKFPIVAIGASAGGLSAFKELLSTIPAHTGFAYILISHLDRTHVSNMPEIIEKFTKMPVVAVKNNIHIQADHVYVITPGSNLIIKKNELILVDQVEPHYANKPIDCFFQSLAEEREENAIGVILSGTGNDGVLGLEEIIRHNGVVLAQDPSEAEYDGMPLSAIQTGLVDYILRANQIQAQLDHWQRYGKSQQDKITAELKQIFQLLQYHTGHDFSVYKLNTIYRRIEKQLISNHVNSVKEYLEILRTIPQEVENLFHNILIGVTSFFRDPSAFDDLKEKIINHLFKHKMRNTTIRVWIPGCSTGEEVYSIAILLKECMQEVKRNYRVQIFGTDIDMRALAIARSAVYPHTITSDVSEKRLKRFFIKEQDGYKIKREIREMVVFGAQVLLKIRHSLNWICFVVEIY